MHLIHKELANHRAPNASTLAEKIGVSPKTIRRDIKCMQEDWELPIEYDAAEHAYSYTREVGTFPPVLVNEGEVLALFVAHQAMSAYEGTPFEKPLHSAFFKLAHSLKGEFSIDLASLDKTLSFKNVGVAEADLTVFDFISQATLHSREVEFNYRKLEDSKPGKRRVQPYHIACVNQLWYLFAFDIDRKEMRTFAVPRIRGPLKRGRAFSKPKNFSLADHLMNSFGVFSSSGEPQEIILDFSPFAARLVSERSWHPSQTLQPHHDGSLTLTLELGSLEEIERWILGWGEHVQVLAPDTLRDRIHQRHLQAATQYHTKATPAARRS